MTEWHPLVALMFVIALGPATASAQTVGANVYRVQVVVSATNTTVTRDIPIAAPAVTCNLAPTATSATPLVNPTAIEIEDDTTAGRACRIQVGNLFSPPSLPTAAGYVATITAVDTTVTPNRLSPVSAPSDPFTSALPPVVMPRMRGVR